MNDMGIAVRSDLRLRADPSRVLLRLFIPGQELVGGSESRATNTVERILALSDDVVDDSLSELLHRFSSRHDDIATTFSLNAQRVADYVTMPLSANHWLLLGAAFTHEFALEGAAVCNPSLVAHPDQSDVAPGNLRVVLSYRAIGEGHQSSICFRTGVIERDGPLRLEEPDAFPEMATINTGLLDRDTFHALLGDLGLNGETATSVLNNLQPRFTSEELEAAIAKLETQSDTRLNVIETAGVLRLMAACFYVATFDERVALSRRVLWPSTPSERQGMEDARFVRLEGEGSAKYVASYTAYDGHSVSQQLLETDDFLTFASSPLAGRGARNKGLAVFPRKIAGRYVALSRHDRESNAIAFSSDLHQWSEVANAQTPSLSWEILQLGNCGSPIELAQGWLVITHGVGPMRTYGLGALLLDLDDPTRVIAQLPRPLLLPSVDEQDGYVPNVVYSCGSLVHHGTLYLPYGIADQSISYVTVALDDLLAAFEPIVSTAGTK